MHDSYNEISWDISYRVCLNVYGDNDGFFRIMLVKKDDGDASAECHFGGGEIPGYRDAYQVRFIAAGELYGRRIVTGIKTF